MNKIVELEPICRNCEHFEGYKFHSNGFLIGFCALEPFEVSDMNSNQIAILCGHDGGVYYGEEFGCKFWKKGEGSTPHIGCLYCNGRFVLDEVVYIKEKYSTEGFRCYKCLEIWDKKHA